MSGLVTVTVVDGCIVGSSKYAVMLWVTRGKFSNRQEGSNNFGNMEG